MLGDDADRRSSSRGRRLRLASPRRRLRGSADVVRRGGAVAASGIQRSSSVRRLGTSTSSDRPRRPRRRRHVGQGQQRRQPHLGVGVGQQPASRIAFDRLGSSRQHLRRRCGARRPTGASALRDRRGGRLGVRAVERAQAVQRPQGVNRRRRSGRSHRPLDRSTSSSSAGTTSCLAALDQQPLRVQPPEHVVVLQRRDQLLGRRVLRGDMAADGFASFAHEPVDAAVRLVAQLAFRRRCPCRS